MFGTRKSRVGVLAVTALCVRSNDTAFAIRNNNSADALGNGSTATAVGGCTVFSVSGTALACHG